MLYVVEKTNQADAEKADVGGSIPSLEIIITKHLQGLRSDIQITEEKTLGLPVFYKFVLTSAESTRLRSVHAPAV